MAHRKDVSWTPGLLVLKRRTGSKDQRGEEHEKAKKESLKQSIGVVAVLNVTGFNGELSWWTSFVELAKQFIITALKPLLQLYNREKTMMVNGVYSITHLLQS